MVQKEKKKKGHPHAAPKGPHLSDEEKRQAAYYRWLERGCPTDDDWNDWFEIENKWGDNI